MNAYLQYILYILLVVALALPLGSYIKRVMSGERTFLSPVLAPLERGILRLLKINTDEQMSYKTYFFAVLAFSGIGLVVVVLLQLLQPWLPGNPQGLGAPRFDLALNTAISYVTNTNWQAYSGEATLSYLVQMLGLTVQNFVSAGAGLAVLFALIRGFQKQREAGLGSFWVDLTRGVVHVLLPLNLILALLLVVGGVIQSFSDYKTVPLLEPVAVTAEGKIVENAIVNPDTLTVTVDGKPRTDLHVVTEQIVPEGPAASQVAIKQTGTNGGGFFGANSAHPFENPSPFTNLLELLSILLLPIALCFSFGLAVKNKRQGAALFAAMLICLVLALACIAVSEQAGTAQLAQGGAVSLDTLSQSGGNMEGKETRFGIASSSTWAVFTTAASNGSVNAMHDSLTPLGGLIPMLLIQLGGVVFGGVGCGLYGMIGFALLTVFIAGLMVGRTPEFLGKKIEPYEMKWAAIVCLTTPAVILVTSGIAALVPSVTQSLNNSGAHGFSELLYAFSSAGGNNGSAFAGFRADTVFLNLLLGLAMLVARFLPTIGVLAIGESLAKKKNTAVSAGTLSTTGGLFVFLLVFVVLLVGALSFFPALALGPLAEFFG